MRRCQQFASFKERKRLVAGIHALAASGRCFESSGPVADGTMGRSGTSAPYRHKIFNHGHGRQ